MSADPTSRDTGSAREADEDEAETEETPRASDALTAADNLSVEPGRMPASGTHGHGWLGTTHPAITNARFKGALPI